MALWDETFMIVKLLVLLISSANGVNGGDVLALSRVTNMLGIANADHNSTLTPMLRKRDVPVPMTACPNEERFSQSICIGPRSPRAYQIQCRRGGRVREGSLFSYTQGMCIRGEICYDRLVGPADVDQYVEEPAATPPGRSGNFVVAFCVGFWDHAAITQMDTEEIELVRMYDERVARANAQTGNTRGGQAASVVIADQSLSVSVNASNLQIAAQSRKEIFGAE